MTAVLTPPETSPAGPFRGLLRAETHRLLARRFIRVLLLLAVLGWVAALLLSLVGFEGATPERRAQAQQARLEQVQASNEGREQCLATDDVPDGLTPEERCGPPVTEADFPLSLFLQPPPFSLSEDADDGVMAVAAVAAALAFVVGATFVGAEWSSRSMVALLFWETRRHRVIGAKVLVTAAATAVLGLVMQALWLGLANLLQAVVGDGVSPPAGFWSTLLAAQGRAVLLTVVAGLLGFGLTNLLRNTGAATGVAFVYVLIVETAVRALLPDWQPWLLTNNAAALVVPDGLTLYLGSDVDDQGTWRQVEYLLGNGQAAVFLVVVTAAVVGVGSWLFDRRDLH